MTGRLGVAVVGLAGAVATTAVAGIEMIRTGTNDLIGLPLRSRASAGLAAYSDLFFAGWDLSSETLDVAARRHGVMRESELADGASPLAAMRAWPAVSSAQHSQVCGENRIAALGHRAAIAQIQSDMARFRTEIGLDRLVMVNLASTERLAKSGSESLGSIDRFEQALDLNDPAISPAMLYAYAAVSSGVPYANFTPSVAADAEPVAALAAARNVPIAGKDGKTGQTLLKTVIAPALRDRALRVDGWFSTNILGNSDGKVLADPEALASKIATKTAVLDHILGYEVEDHVVMIHYYRPRGDDKEAWDNIDLTGFLGRRMQLKLNFLCRDSVLAAPLVIEIARCLDLAAQRGEGGVQEQLALFFKMPQTRTGAVPHHDFAEQQRALDRWLDRSA